MKRKTWRNKELREVAPRQTFEWVDRHDRNSTFSYCYLYNEKIQLYIDIWTLSGEEHWRYPDVSVGQEVYELRIYKKNRNGNNQLVYSHPDYSLDLELAKRDLEDIFLNMYPPLRKS